MNPGKENLTETASIGEYTSAELTVQDNALMLSLDATAIAVSKELFEMNHFGVIVCAGVDNAIDIYRRDNPALVIADIGACREQYLELIRTIRGTDESVPIILVAAEAERDFAIHGVEVGAYDYIEKPVQARVFRLAIRRALQYREFVRFKRAYRRMLEEEVGEKTLEIARRKDFLKGILDSSTLVSVVLTDLDQNILFWNTGAENIFGYTSEEMTGEKITKLYPPDASTRDTVERLQQLIQTKTGTVHGKMQQVAKDGRILTISLAISPDAG